MKKTEVFISYMHKDKAIADSVCQRIEIEDINCYIAPRDITPGSNWKADIVSAIAKCKIFVLIFSSAANESMQVNREVEIAVTNKLEIIPIRIGDAFPTDSMMYFLSTAHWLDASSLLDDKNKPLISKLKNSLNGKSLEYSSKAAMHTNAKRSAFRGTQLPSISDAISNIKDNAKVRKEKERN